MQGWRKGQEDAHLHIFDIIPNVHLFAVFDGHGGKEVSRYCERHLPKMLQSNEDFCQHNFDRALKTVFLKIDMQLISKAGRIELSKLARGGAPYGGVVNSAQIPFQSGCTANLILVTPTQIICANSGDSRSVVSEAGKAVELSWDHKPCPEPSAIGNTKSSHCPKRRWR